MYQQIAVINDYAGVGRVAANVNVPILSAAQFEVAVLPTLLLSNQVGFNSFYTREMEEDFDVFLNHWKTLDLDFEACLTGYFAATAQIDSVIQFVENSKKEFPVIVDPIMGEDGELYPGFTEEFVAHMRNLIVHADIVMPNVTEACRIAQIDYSEEFTEKELEEVAQKILSMSAKNVILTGIRLNTKEYADQIGFFLKRQGEPGCLIMHKYYETAYAGTGDLAFSIISSFYLRGKDLKSSIERCAHYMVKTFEASALKSRSEFGIHFESLIPEFAVEVDQWMNRSLTS